ncbi:hypothetical protein DFP92_10880 [Yoonia sediminilitoris]|uniref:Uncharacterized protein n=1 Tax=Yoonia sediminilitoris TaxID=1286148 RepID=A0A2T6KDS1_9RHOB|nr:hypothetical protein C8N45_10879 [Yoonia sediminilitoris]RCW94493.1 hypothetical protein DFP92_10880 [Yoonia sediminilitoris]
MFPSAQKPAKAAVLSPHPLARSKAGKVPIRTIFRRNVGDLERAHKPHHYNTAFNRAAPPHDEMRIFRNSAVTPNDIAGIKLEPACCASLRVFHPNKVLQLQIDVRLGRAIAHRRVMNNLRYMTILEQVEPVKLVVGKLGRAGKVSRFFAHIELAKFCRSVRSEVYLQYPSYWFREPILPAPIFPGVVAPHTKLRSDILQSPEILTCFGMRNRWLVCPTGRKSGTKAPQPAIFGAKDRSGPSSWQSSVG